MNGMYLTPCWTFDQIASADLLSSHMYLENVNFDIYSQLLSEGCHKYGDKQCLKFHNMAKIVFIYTLTPENSKIQNSKYSSVKSQKLSNSLFILQSDKKAGWRTGAMHPGNSVNPWDKLC